MVVREGRVFATQLGLSGTVIRPRRDQILSTRSGDPMVMGEERELFQGDLVQ